MYKPDQILNWQQDQYEHDMKYHFDILSLHRNDRLKHYALHFAKYAGRIARGDSEAKPVVETFTDALLVCLSAANTLQQHLEYRPKNSNGLFLIRLTDAAGRVCDAAEKIDHLEPFMGIAKDGNQDFFDTLMDFAVAERLDAQLMLNERRAELRIRQFFIR
ncbi:hypothetical protein AL073_00030 [Loktanella sp. 1ANDIMAR09]|nr:hypothetical protein AL073_00030 [Loktanella sp. 1ANDIMAR09]